MLVSFFLFQAPFITAKTVDDEPPYIEVKGKIFFRVSALSGVTLDDHDYLTYEGSYPYFDNLLSVFNIYVINRPYSGAGLGEVFDRTYVCLFDTSMDASDLVDSLLAYDFIEHVEISKAYLNFGEKTLDYVLDPMLNEQYGLVNCKVLEAHEYSEGEGITIAVIDAGIDLDHEDLQGVLWENDDEINGTPGVDDDANGYIDDYNGWNVVDHNNAIGLHPLASSAHFSHGTIVTGVIAAQKSNKKGICGVAPKAKIMTIKVVSDDTSLANSQYIYNTEDALFYAIKSPAQIINMSWGGPNPYAMAQASVLNHLITAADDHNKLLIAAAGNGPSSEPGGGYPDTTVNIYSASFEYVVSVGGTAFNNQKAVISNYGVFGSVKIMAPGEEVLTTNVGSTYSLADGTSLSAPFVAGVAALVWSINPSLGNYELRDILYGSADDISSMNWQIRDKIGVGQVNALDAVLNRIVKSNFDILGPQVSCKGDTVTFTTKTRTGITFEWDFEDATSLVQTSDTFVKHVFNPGLITSPKYFSVKLKLLNALSEVVDDTTINNIVYIHPCDSNLPTKDPNEWTFSKAARMSFMRGTPKGEMARITYAPYFTMNSSLAADSLGNVKAIAGGSASSFYRIFDDSMRNLSVDTFGNIQDEPNQTGFIQINKNRYVLVETGLSLLTHSPSKFALRYSIYVDSIYITFGSDTFSGRIASGYANLPITGPVNADYSSDNGLLVRNGLAVIPDFADGYWIFVKPSGTTYKDSVSLFHFRHNRPGFFQYVRSFVLPGSDFVDNIKANADGDKIIFTASTFIGCYVCDFNRQTGQLTLKQSFTDIYATDACFSPNGKFLYVWSHEGVLNYYDLEYKEPDLSRQILFTDLYNGADAYMGGTIQTGPDKQLYFNSFSEMYSPEYVMRISEPNTPIN
jgi:hypothetical protein